MRVEHDHQSETYGGYGERDPHRRPVFARARDDKARDNRYGRAAQGEREHPAGGYQYRKTPI